MSKPACLHFKSFIQVFLEWVPELWMTLHLGLGKITKQTNKIKNPLPVLFFALGQKTWKTRKHTWADKDAIYCNSWFSIQMTYLHLARPCMFTTTLILEKVCLPSVLVVVHTPWCSWLGSWTPGLWGRWHPRVLPAIWNQHKILTSYSTLYTAIFPWIQQT